MRSQRVRRARDGARHAATARRSHPSVRCPTCAVLVGLYEEPEKPNNALDFVKMTLGAPTGVDVEALTAENDQLRQKNDEMTQKIVELTLKVRSGPAASCGAPPRR